MQPTDGTQESIQQVMERRKLSGCSQVRIFYEVDQREPVESVCNRWLRENFDKIEIFSIQTGWESMRGTKIMVWWRYK